MEYSTEKNCREFIDRLNEADRFCKVNGIRLIHAEPGFSVAELEITPDVYNAGGVVQGGAIFTLADFAFAGAANAGSQPGERIVMMNSTISVVRPGSGSKLRAEAKEIHRGKRTGLYEIQVTDDRGKLVAKITSTGFITSIPVK